VLKHWQRWRDTLDSLATRLSQEPGYRLRSYGEVEQAARLGYSLDVNRATVDDWLRLPGLSIRQAQALVRLRHGGIQFHCLEDVAAALGTTAAHLQPLAPVLSFCYYDSLGEGPPAVSINQATTQQLSGVPGLPATLARAVVQERSQRGPYRDLADLQHRLGLTADLMQALIHYLRP
jgi:DNA uptake protein ComE-like DNA-binding protein